MDVFKRMIRDYEEQKGCEYELTNPCTHGESGIRPFIWDGRTMCGDCCEHEYADKVVNHHGSWLCLLCAELLPQSFRIIRPGTITMKKYEALKRKRIPKILVFDENGRRVKVRYAKKLSIQK